MRELNLHEQENRYNSLRQGERESIAAFKTRFDEQVFANDGVGVAQISESRRALDFLMKLDPKRFTEMLDQMKNDALRKKPEAYPSTLAGACRIASGWSRGIPAQAAPATKDAAYVTDTALVATVKEPEKPVKKTGGTKKKNILTETICYVCGLIGHYARNCSERKSQVDKVHITSSK